MLDAAHFFLRSNRKNPTHINDLSNLAHNEEEDHSLVGELRQSSKQNEFKFRAACGAVPAQSLGEALGRARFRAERVFLACVLPERLRSRAFQAAIKAAIDAGMDIGRVEIKITIFAGKSGESNGAVMNNGEVLTPDDELERWRRKRNAS